MNKKIMDFELTKKQTKSVLDNIKKKKIKNMEVFDLMFIIENDDTLISAERIEYETELLRKLILNK